MTPRVRGPILLWIRMAPQLQDFPWTPDPIERRAVLTAVKTASRRLERWPSASLDSRCARHAADPQAGTEKRPTPNQETSQNPTAIGEVSRDLRAQANEMGPL
jgi:hypothetical protein